MFLSYLPQNTVISDKLLYTLSWINWRYNSLNDLRLTWIVSLHYLVKLSIAFCKWTATGTANPKTTPNVFVTSSTKSGRFWLNFCSYCPECICHRVLLGRITLVAQWPIVVKLSRGRSVGSYVRASVSDRLVSRPVQCIVAKWRIESRCRLAS